MLQLRQYLSINLVHLRYLTLKIGTDVYFCIVINLSPAKMAKKTSLFFTDVNIKQILSHVSKILDPGNANFSYLGQGEGRNKA